jgi:peptidoglycan/LPS O-acetylase OafA/YrhL
MRPPGVFRPDIEGLRAIAIGAVVLYHADVPGFGSGYIGVDAFFVISGFLITGILVREADRTQHIDLLRFWGRRAARLLPNAILTLTATTVGIMTLASVLTREAGAGDVAATLLYYANFHFSARTLDYFDQGVQSSPVLHFWSLSVEEQFYLFWPVCIVPGLWVFKRLNRPVTLVFLGVLALGSFAAMIYWSRIEPSRAFFDTESRVWQLAIGAMLAVRLSAGPTPRPLAAAIGWVGLVGLLLSIGLLDLMPLNPRVASVIPTLAAAAALYGGSGSPAYGANPVLGNAVMQWIGRRSYSLYLWHWPLLVFAAPFIGRGFTIALVVSIASLAFAWVEQPIRIGAPARLSPPKLVGFAIASCCGAAALALVLPSLDPAYSSARGSFLTRLTVARTDSPRMIGPSCKSMEDAETGICVFGKPGGAKRVALYGDSHAEHLFDGLNAAAAASGWELRIWVRGGCSPIDFETNDAACTQFHRDVFEAMPAYKPDSIVVASANGGSVHLHERVTGKAIEKQQSVALWKAGYKRSLERLSGLVPRVVVVRDTPGNTKAMGTECLETRAPESCVTPRSDAFPDGTPDADVAATVPSIGLLDLTDRFCDSRSCPAMKDGSIVYRADNNHITATVSLGLASDFVKMLEGER